MSEPREEVGVPIGLGVWRIDGGLRQVPFNVMESEVKLEEVLVGNPELLGLDLLIIGQQVRTDFGKRIDLLGIDADGTLHVIELKKDRTPRDIVAQALDYGSWARHLGYDDVVAIYEQHNKDGSSFEAAFDDRFDATPPEVVNSSHQLAIVAAELDASTERIVSYLSDEYGVPINVVFFRYMRDGEAEYLTRTWLIDPAEVAEAAPKKTKEQWNGQDFYISFGEDSHRSWEDARRYGFVSGGGGTWYTKSLSQLFVGARVFVHIPQTGYVGVGKVVEEVQPVGDFMVDLDSGSRVPILEAPLDAPGLGEWKDDPELTEKLVRVEWIETRPVSGAVWESGFFANQNTACKLRNRFTLSRLVDVFGLGE